MHQLVEKNKEYQVEIIDQGMDGEGIAKIDGFTIFISGAIKGEICKIIIVKVTKSHAFGKLIDVLESSTDRVNNDCMSYPRCGGCQIRHMSYNVALKLKKQNVQNLVNKMLKTNIVVEDVIGMQKPYHYRNKSQYPVGIDKNGFPVVGIFAQRTHDIVPIQECKIQNPIAKNIADFIIKFAKENNITPYNEKTGMGILRHIVIRIGEYTKEIMCILVINALYLDKQEMLVKELVEEFPDIKTVVLNTNQKCTNVILGKQNNIIYGKGYIIDFLNKYKFKISPMSFYQVNSIQTEKLYQMAIEMAEIEKKDIVFDLYCGIGTIGIFASEYAREVYGIEIVEQAIEDAKENARINEIKNTTFLAGDVEQVFYDLICKDKIHPDVVIVDPPRKGLDARTIDNLMKIKPKRIVYISCNPATLIRDLSYMEESYMIKRIKPVDMFPYTSHVECVAVLQLKQDR